MKIQIPPHTLLRAVERGATEDEIKETMRNGVTLTAKLKRLAKYKVFDFYQTRNNKYYEQKKVEVYYIEENGEIITVTVYVFYGKWEG